MSALLPGLNQALPFYVSGPMPCPYLPDRVERKLFTRLEGDKATNTAINAALTRAGFRRSHDIVYRPACTSCSACVPIRIAVRDVKLSRSLNRIANRNRDLTLNSSVPSASGDMFDVFSRYEKTRHADSDMAHMSRAEFDAMLQEGNAATSLYTLRRPIRNATESSLLGVMIADQVLDGFSAVYSFFEPDEPKRSLGTQLILSLITEAERLNLPYVYLGYWIAAARKMAYKGKFPGAQALGPQGWTSLSDSPSHK